MLILGLDINDISQIDVYTKINNMRKYHNMNRVLIQITK